ncbi:MAG TPA: cell division protein SepF [Methylomusa anaerophila]|uniref:Cell division protein SepF n=1 Tax=Methylomusa anaerophila TaxID=1930071 RepID=A0A348ANP6_9FIRM|nr:cell division protein SepF [Methylomusa anaerophila]BBB92694.1 cell division protein SepF [Methylomusa anaerophila]HML87453.1 cell division protein SepF [Methylomusa anaerophila]
MAFSLIDKLTNFLMPLEETATEPESSTAMNGRENIQEATERKHHLRVHTAAVLKIFVDVPTCFDDVQLYADHLKSNAAIVVNYHQVDSETQQRISDFLNGVCYILGGMVQRVSEQVVIYAYANIEIDKKIYAYSVPTYVRVKGE